MVADDQDYKGHFTDPDTLVNWDCVQQVVNSTYSSLFQSREPLSHLTYKFLVLFSVFTVMRCHLARSASILLWRHTSLGVDIFSAGHACCTTCLSVTRAGPSAQSATRLSTLVI